MPLPHPPPPTPRRYVFDYHPGDIFWCTADCGWITGHSYVTYGPLIVGAPQVIFEGVPTFPDAGRCWQVVDKYKVTLFYTAPTAIRTLMACGDDFVTSYKRDTLRVLGTVGEPINPEAWRWYYEVGGCWVLGGGGGVGGACGSPAHHPERSPGLEAGTAVVAAGRQAGGGVHRREGSVERGCHSHGPEPWRLADLPLTSPLPPSSLIVSLNHALAHPPAGRGRQQVLHRGHLVADRDWCTHDHPPARCHSHEARLRLFPLLWCGACHP